jgi:hypothetical protein
MDIPEQLLMPEDVARWLGAKRKWVIDHTSRYEPIIPHLRLGKAIRFRRADVERFLSRQVSTKAWWANDQTR